MVIGIKCVMGTEIDIGLTSCTISRQSALPRAAALYRGSKISASRQRTWSISTQRVLKDSTTCLLKPAVYTEIN